MDGLMKKTKQHYIDGMKPFGKFLYYTGSVRIYANADCIGFVWKWWNPMSWILAPIAILISILVQGIPDIMKNPSDIGLKLDPYFHKNSKKVEWL